MIRRSSLGLIALLLGSSGRAVAQEAARVAYTTGDPDLDALPGLLSRTLEANLRRFTGVSGRVCGFGAGQRYPQIWVRDNATVLPLSRYLYPRECLTSWIEEHLAHQLPTGEIYDWIAAGAPATFLGDSPQAREVGRTKETILSADRNTVASDQESSLVLAVTEVFALTGSNGWRRGPPGARGVLERAQGALNAVLRHRQDENGLIAGGFAADWGDVSPQWPDQRAIYLDAETPRVGSLYASALFGGAAVALADLLESMDERGRAAYWRHHAGRVRDAIERCLWQEGRGFYRMQATSPLGDQSDRFALGGNAVALLTGPKDPVRLGRLLDVAEQRRRRFAVSTIASALVPPFPRGFFRHPALREEWSYQNGGQWDWFAARLLLAAFEGGESSRGYTHLHALARKAVENAGLFEWHSRDGRGQGSPAYAGSAGALAAALFQGLFGVHLTAERLSLTVRLGQRSGRIELLEPATDTSVAYRYEYEAGGRHLRLAYESSHPRPGQVALLLPAGRRATLVQRDGRPVPFERSRVGRDDYVAVPTDFRPHVLEVTLE